MLTASVDGIAPDEGVARRTLQALRLIAANHRLVYLPTHDPESGRRLETLESANVSG
jgi:hypothetical protein